MEPNLLFDKSRLQEIYDLRIIAWEQSDNAPYINRKYFPNGWKDKFDEQALHWIIEKDNEIVASARIAIVNSISEFEEDLSMFGLSKSCQIAFFSRLVVHPGFREMGLAKTLDRSRMECFLTKPINYAIAFANEMRIPQMLSLGFGVLGTVSHLYGDNPLVDYSTALLYKKHE